MQSHLISVEIGGTKLQVALGNADGQIAAVRHLNADAAGGAAAIVQQLVVPIRELMTLSSVEALGIGFGGPVNHSTQRVILSNHVAGWENFDLPAWARQEFDLPCRVGNDTDVAALAEAKLGAGRNAKTVFYTNIGSGIGGGLVVDGELYSKPTGAMEIGHNTVFSKLENKHGILEEFCSGWSLNQRARNAVVKNPDSAIGAGTNSLDEITARNLFAAWQKRDPVAMEIVDDFLECYGRVLANMVALLNPDVIVIGGGVSKAGDPFRQAVNDSIAEFVYQPFAENFRVELAGLGDQCVPVGGLLLASRAFELGS